MTKSKDQAVNFISIANFGKHDNSVILRTVPRTKRDYRCALYIFNKFVSLHPKAVNPHGIQTFKAFIQFVARRIKVVSRRSPQCSSSSLRKFLKIEIVGLFDSKESILTTACPS